MSEFVMSKVNTVQGEVEAIQVTRENIRMVARYFGGEVQSFDLRDEAQPELWITLSTIDRHLNAVDDRAGIGEWIVRRFDRADNVAVYADKLFLTMIGKSDAYPRELDEDKHENVAKILTQLMEYQDFVTGKGGGTAETVSAAELAALQIWYEFR